MAQIPASKESIQKLYENMGSNFSFFVPQLCSCVSSLESLEQINENECENVNALSLWKMLLKLHLFSLLIDVDLSTFLRADFRSTSDPEKRCNLKYVNVITFEGYNYLFGISKNKNNAIWQIFKRLAAQINNDELIKDINDIEQRAKEFENSLAQSIDRDNRNLSIHYDSDPLKVYNFLSQISEETETIRTNAFLKIIDDLIIFVNKYILKFQIPLICSTNNYDIDFWEKINLFPDKDRKLFTNFDEKIVSFGKQLDHIVAQCRMPKIVQEKLNLDDSFTERLQPMINSIQPGLHILFIYLDLASAIRAYLSSEYYFEKQLNLRRINVVVYEGFKHIYGYTDSEHLKSFWQQKISSILKESTNTNLTDSLTIIESELKKLAADKGINNMQLRECSVHYRFKESDNTIQLFHALVKSNPLIELNKALKLIQILPELMKLNSDSMSVVYNLEHDKIKSINIKTVAQIDTILTIIEQANMDPESRQKMIDNTIKIKSLLLL
jgi:hypothetical protein